MLDRRLEKQRLIRRDLHRAGDKVVEAMERTLFLQADKRRADRLHDGDLMVRVALLHGSGRDALRKHRFADRDLAIDAADLCIQVDQAVPLPRLTRRASSLHSSGPTSSRNWTM